MKKNFVILFICIIVSFTHGNEKIRFFWSLGDIGICWDLASNKPELFPILNVGNLNWITNTGIGWGVHLFNIEGSDTWTQWLLFPVEINFSPQVLFAGIKENPFISLYGRGGWLIRNVHDGINRSLSERSSFFGAIGLKAMFFPLVGESWSLFSGGFIEYTTTKEFRIGVSVDVAILAVAWAYLSSRPKYHEIPRYRRRR